MSTSGSENHYNRPFLTDAILSALISSGKDPASINTMDLAPVDELHVRGRKATVELADKLDLKPGMSVLDIGSGIGGAARYLAEYFGCHVTGIDLTYNYCHAAKRLGELTSLDDKTVFVQGDATRLPFPDSCFSVVWTIHTAMNINNKALLYGEIYRVLKPGGTLAIYDILQGEGGEIYTPVPWAMTAQQSHLSRPSELLMHLQNFGFSISVWNDLTDTGKKWFKRLSERIGSDSPPLLGVNLLFGRDFPQMARNQVLNLQENKIVLVECIATRSA